MSLNIQATIKLDFVPTSIALNDQASAVAVGGFHEKYIELWNVSDRILIARLDILDSLNETNSISWKGSYLTAITDNDNAVMLWKTSEIQPELIKKFEFIDSISYTSVDIIDDFLLRTSERPLNSAVRKGASTIDLWLYNIATGSEHSIESGLIISDAKFLNHQTVAVLGHNPIGDGFKLLIFHFDGNGISITGESYSNVETADNLNMSVSPDGKHIAIYGTLEDNIDQFITSDFLTIFSYENAQLIQKSEIKSIDVVYSGVYFEPNTVVVIEHILKTKKDVLTKYELDSLKKIEQAQFHLPGKFTTAFTQLNSLVTLGLDQQVALITA